MTPSVRGLKLLSMRVCTSAVKRASGDNVESIQLALIENDNMATVFEEALSILNDNSNLI